VLLDADAAKVAQVMPLVPFAPAIIKLNEARIRMEDVHSQQARLAEAPGSRTQPARTRAGGDRF
jgi:hypothetical protein